MKYKYDEDRILKDVESYIRSTYNQHYVGKTNVQTIDMWDAIGIAAEACQSNVIKYISRYGKKGGYNRKDLLKAIHYAILLDYFTSEKQNEVKDDATSRSLGFNETD